MRIKKNLALFVLLLGTLLGAKAQNFALKTNLLSDALLNVNLGMEAGLAPHWSLDVSGQLNLWSVDGRKWKHYAVQPEARYWFCDRFAGHFLGLHVMGGQYNFGHIRNHVNFLGSDFSKLTNYRYQGWAVGAGVGYGYSWVLNKHWNLEAELGLGWMYTRFDVFECKNCGKKIESDKPHNYFGPTKAAINLVYVF